MSRLQDPVKILIDCPVLCKKSAEDSLLNKTPG